MSEEIHVGDVGTEFRITILEGAAVVDLSSASSIDIIIKRPDGTLITANGSLYTDGTDGIIYYNILVGDLDQGGIYKIQAVVTIGAATYSSSIGSFKVMCNL